MELRNQIGFRVDVWANCLDEETGSYKASIVFNGCFVLVWLLVQRSGKIY
jgi:hypothetical protein